MEADKLNIVFLYTCLSAIIGLLISVVMFKLLPYWFISSFVVRLLIFAVCFSAIQYLFYKIYK